MYALIYALYTFVSVYICNISFVFSLIKFDSEST